VRIGPDERVGEGDATPLIGPRGDDRREVLEVHLVDDPGAGGHDAEVVERSLRPAQELVTLAVALVLPLDVEGERAWRPEPVDLHGLVDVEVRRDERVDSLRVAAELGHRVAHDREVHNRRDAGEVLEDDPGRHERDLDIGPRPRTPRREGLDVLGADDPAAGMAEHVLEEDLERDRCLSGIEAEPGQGVKAIAVGEASAESGSGAEGIEGRHAR
jgi:hypothetical protein